MSPEWVAIYITIVGLIGTAANIWIALIVKNAVLGIKLWCKEEFVTKEEHISNLAPLREAITLNSSTMRVVHGER